MTTVPLKHDPSKARLSAYAGEMAWKEELPPAGERHAAHDGPGRRVGASS